MLTPADYMDRALFHASRGRGRTSPNPAVGAIVVSPDGIVVGYGFHARAGAPHAEIGALEMAGPRARGATLYCTLEPCSPFGPGVTRRTGPCVVRIVDAGVARVVAAVEDPNPLVSGRGFQHLRQHGIDVEVGLRADQALALNQPYFTLMQEKRPFVILKAAMSLDGYIAEAPGRRTQLTSAPADRHAHQQRAEIDAIGVGVGTILVDDPMLTPRGVYRERPLVRVVFDRDLRMPPTATVLSTRASGPVIIVTTEQSANRADARRQLEACGAEIEVARDGTLRAAMERLGARQIESVVLEGGAKIHHAAWDEQIADFVQLYVTPRVIGPGGVPFLDARVFSTALLVDRRTEPIGPDVLIEGYVHRPH